MLFVKWPLNPFLGRWLSYFGTGLVSEEAVELPWWESENFGFIN